MIVHIHKAYVTFVLLSNNRIRRHDNFKLLLIKPFPINQKSSPPESREETNTTRSFESPKPRDVFSFCLHFAFSFVSFQRTNGKGTCVCFCAISCRETPVFTGEEGVPLATPGPASVNTGRFRVIIANLRQRLSLGEEGCHGACCSPRVPV